MTEQKIRTLAFYQPFLSLMIWGKKKETRWVRKNKKPPFPLGVYAFYSTRKPCTHEQLMDWSGIDIMLKITEITGNDPYKYHNGYLLASAKLLSLRPMAKEDEELAYVKFVGERTVKDKNGNDVVQVQWILEFDPVLAIEPVKFNEGKQGVGFLPEKYLKIAN